MNPITDRTHSRRTTGFSLLEVLVALVVLGAVVVVGLGSVSAGAQSRARVAEQAELRVLAEQKLAELSALPDRELSALAGQRDGSFAPPWADAFWVSRVREEGEGTGLYLVEVEVRRQRAAFRAATYLNRFGERWRTRRNLES